MFSSTIRSSLLALTLGAMSVVAAPGLSLKVAGVNTADGVENLKVTATLTNTGDDTIKLLNDPRTALSKVPTNSFAITSKAGKTPAFAGVKVKYSPSYVAEKNADSSFTVLKAGESIDIEHDLASAYSFVTSGADDYDIEASTLFRYLDSSNKVQEITASSETKHTAKLTGNLKSTLRDAGFSKRATFTSGLGKRIDYNGCSDDEQSTLVTAAGNANDFATETLEYVSGISSGTDRYTTWFGEYTDARHSTVVDQYQAIKDNDFSTSYTFDCTCTDSDTYAYVYPDQFGTIYLCGVFWDTTDTGTDSRAGTLIHESSHFTKIAGTDDNVYGQSGAKELAISDPDAAIDNADSHEYFSENTPSQD